MQGTAPVAVPAPQPAAELDDRSPADLSLVEIAQRLEQVTSMIEAQRVRERDARRDYKAIADEVEARIASIRAAAKALLDEQRRRMASFDGMLGRPGQASRDPGGPGALSELKPLSRGGNGAGRSSGGRKSARLSLADAILQIWSSGAQTSPLTTPEIAAALTELGYTSKASARSMKSTMNQTLAKLCRSQKLRRFRIDGTEISHSDGKSRARRYMPA